MINKQTKQSKYRRASFKANKQSKALNGIVAFGMRRWLKRRIKFTMNNSVGRLDRPAIVLCNHGSFVDFVYSSLLLAKEKPHVVTTRQYFYNKRLGRLLYKLGCIPKSLFTNDVENVKNCLEVLKSNGVLVICPEARLTTVGQFQDVQPSTMSFLHKMSERAAIYTIKLHGNYLALPKWARDGNKRFIRRGSVVEGELGLLYEKGQGAAASLQEFSDKVQRALDYNEFDWLSQHPELHYPQGNLAVGLHNVLYRCPKCGSEFTLTASGNTITCSNCGASETMDDRYNFTLGATPFTNHQQWFNWQMEVLKQQIDADPNFELREQVTLKHSSLNGKTQLREAGNGTCVFNRNGLTYTGTDDGENIVKTFPMSQIYCVMFGAGADFEMYDGKEFWYFVPSDGRVCVKWYMTSLLLRK